MIKRLLPLLLVLGGFLAHAAPARAETYYIDYVGGSNAYDGKEKIHTTGITGPWKNGHGQGNCSDLCSSTTINPGDRMVYKGGVTWPFPEPLWNVLYSGSAGNPITVTTDATWYTGVAWSRPIWDNEYTYQVIVYMASQSYWDFEGIEMKRIQVHDPGEGGMFLIIGNSAHINFRNLYIHGWRLDGTGQRRDGKQGGININPDVGSQAQSIRIEDSEIENSENTGVYTNNGYGLKYVGTVLRTSIHDMPAATIQVLDVDGSEMYNIGHPSGNGSAGGGLAYPDDPHLNVAYVDPGALFATTGYIRNSIFHDNDGGLEGMAMCLANGNFGEREVFIYNNLFYGVMPASSGAIALDPYDPNGTMVGGSCYVYNNTIYMQDSTRQLAIGGNGRSDTNYTNISIQNNHFIGNGSGHPYTDLTQYEVHADKVNGTFIVSNNYPASGGQDPAAAITQGYVSPVWGPTNGLAPTIGAGANLSAAFTTDLLGITRTPPFDIGAYQYVPAGLTYYVSRTTNSPAGNDSNDGLTLSTPFATLQHCYGVVTAGDTCEVRGGTYNQGFQHVGEGYTASGTDFEDGQILVQPYNGETVIFQHGSEKGILIFHGSTSSLYWHFKDIIFDGSTGYYSGSGSGGELIGGDADYIWLENLEAKYGVNNGLSPDGDHWTLTNLNVHHNGTVHNVDGVQYHGVYAGGTYLDIDGGQYHENAGSGIQIFASGSNSVSFNVVHDAAIWGNDTYAANCGCAELEMGNGEGNGAYNNWIDRIDVTGIQVDYRCGLYGAPCFVYNNTITSSSKVGVSITSSPLGTIVRGNIIYVPGGTTYVDLGTSSVINHNLLNTNPLFTDAASHDYSLLTISPAVSCGVDAYSLGITGMRTDFIGTARPNGSAADCGAYQVPSDQPPDVALPVSLGHGRMHR